MAKAPKKSFINKKLVGSVLLIALIAGLGAFGGIYYKKYQELNKATPESRQKAQVDQYVQEVSKLYATPNDEEPSVATVKDKDALKKQYPFFDQAEENDVVLIYEKAQVVLLYRPSTKQLIKVGPVNVEKAAAIKVLGTEGDRSSVEQLLKSQNVSYTSGSAKSTPRGITVVDLSGKNADLAKNLAAIVKGSVGNLPEGEEKPADTDLVVLVGPTQ